MAEQIPDLNVVENSSDTTIAANYYRDLSNFAILNKTRSIETSSELILNKTSEIQWFIDTCKTNLNKSANLSYKGQLRELYNEITFHGGWFLRIFQMIENILLRPRLFILNASFSGGFYSMRNILNEEYRLLEEINANIVINKNYIIDAFPPENVCERIIAKVVDFLTKLQAWVDVEKFLLGQAGKIAESQTRAKLAKEGKKGFFSSLFGS